jgi:methionyl-tRNA formyltransferase
MIAELNHPAGVLVSYGKIIPQSTLDLFTPGIINVHPSLLPKYRGPSPIETAILSGDEETGVSIMQLSAAMDAGPVYAQVRYSLDGTELIDSLYTQLGFIGNKLLVETLASILDGSLQPTPQNDTAATYCQLIKKSDGVIDWNKPTEQIAREIRAYKGWPQSRTTLGGIEVIVTKATPIYPIDNSVPGNIKVVYDEDVKTLFVGTADGSLEIDALKPLGKKEMPVSAFLAGYRTQLDA